MAHIVAIGRDVNVLEMIERTFRWTEHRTSTSSFDRQCADDICAVRPDVIIMDMPSTTFGGTEICRAIRARAEVATIPIIAITDRRDPEGMASCFGAGCDDYLAMPFPPRELQLHTESLLRRFQRQSESQPNQPMEVGSTSLDADRLMLTHDGCKIRLTPVERDLLVCLMSRPGQIFPLEALLQEVWHYPLGTGDPTLVRIHVHNLRQKLASDTTASPLIRTVSRQGYTVDKPSPEDWIARPEVLAAITHACPLSAAPH